MLNKEFMLVRSIWYKLNSVRHFCTFIYFCYSFESRKEEHFNDKIFMLLDVIYPMSTWLEILSRNGWSWEEILELEFCDKSVNQDEIMSFFRDFSDRRFIIL